MFNSPIRHALSLPPPDIDARSPHARATRHYPPLIMPVPPLTASPSPLSSGLPSPTFHPLPLPRSPVINVASVPNGNASPRRTAARSLTHLKFDFDDHPSPVSPASPSSSSLPEDVLSPGDLVGAGLLLQDEPVALVPMPTAHTPVDPAGEFEVIRRLGTGSYAVVYLVREVLARREHSDDGCIGGRMDAAVADSDAGEWRDYGRDYAIKVLSKANLDQQALAAQMTEANIHQSIPTHPNIVTLHRTLESPSFLLLLLEFVPGEDLFYFLEQARDHYEPEPAAVSPISPSTPSSPTGTATVTATPSSRTPPTPSLLSSLNPAQLLSRTRLKLIASMFAQMCDAVAACHDATVFHRDIKPENFIVTDGWTARERRVVVKLTDFGLSTNEVESADMDCGSAPYMSYECRNNCAPKYSPRAADVWSLGIVLINMLYHINPWTDTTQGACASFSFFRSDPQAFFAKRFAGMTPAVASFLTERVFCILDADDPLDHKGRRIGAREFGAWVKDLPTLLGPDAQAPAPALVVLPGHKRGVSVSSIGFSLSSVPQSRRPSSRKASLSDPQSQPAASGTITPSLRGRSLSRAPSFGIDAAVELPTLFDNDLEEDGEGEMEAEAEVEAGDTASRSTSVARRRKRGARKGKGQQQAHTPGAVPTIDTLETLASASQSLARELSRTSHSQRMSPALSRTGSSQLRALPMQQAHSEPLPPVPPVPAPVLTPAPITKKPSKWKLGFGKSSSNNNASVNAVAAERGDEKAGVGADGTGVSATANTVSNLIMGLSAPASQGSSRASNSEGSVYDAPTHVHQCVHPTIEPWSRGRHGHQLPNASSSTVSSGTIERWAHSVQSNNAALAAIHGGNITSFITTPTIGSSTIVKRASIPDNRTSRRTSPHRVSPPRTHPSERNPSPTSTRAGRPPVTSSAASIAPSSHSSNWRSSTSSTSTSAFTRYSNSSARSVSTAATSVSAGSWRNSSSGASVTCGSQAQSDVQRVPPANVKFMTGVPWALDELPRQLHPNPVGDIFGSPPVRKTRMRKPKDLPTISERPAAHGHGPSPMKSPLSQRQDAAASATDLRGAVHGGGMGNGNGNGSNHGNNLGNGVASGSGSGGGGGGDGNDGDIGDGAPRKVQKGQITALAKMLSALRL